MSTEKYTFLFYSVDAVGHFNASIGLAGPLRDRGHKIVFATPKGWKGRLEPLGFIEECYDNTEEEISPKYNDKWGKMANENADKLAMSPMDQCINFLLPVFAEVSKQIKFSEAALKDIVARIKPDAIVVDTCFHMPYLLEIGIPWVLSVSFNPISVSQQNVPPPLLGLPMEGDPTIWTSIEETRKAACKEIIEDFNNYLKERGVPEIKYNFPFFIPFSPFANIYMYPEELDYTAYRPNPPKFHRFDSFVRMTNEIFEIPEKLKNLQGKLIYFSMGTIGCSELGLMKRLIGILAKSPNRFIISKGPLADQIDLPDNMWGAPSVPQTKVIPLVDLVITHGGNNTITESFYFGKRVLVLPLFGDQWDNGQRIFETGLGLQFYPFKVKEEELLQGIETLLKDTLLERRMISISKRIQSSNSQARAADVIENVARNNKK
jgi:UDP:flavonoid glycosyltransferase YjiC (YdhE family)